MEAISLEEVRAEAIYRIDLINRACPALKDKASLFEAAVAKDQMDCLIEDVQEDYEEHCLEENLPPDAQETYLAYVTGKIFSNRQNRLLLTIELYHLLNFADRYCTEKPDTPLTQTFKRYADAENTTCLREFIEADLKDLKSGLANDPEDKTCDTLAKRRMLQKCEYELNEATLDISSAKARTVQFGIDTIAAYTISNVTAELEFAAAVAVNSATYDHESFQMRKKYLSELLQHLGEISAGMVKEPEWKDDRSVEIAGRSSKLH